jgi:hypothetical protein
MSNPTIAAGYPKAFLDFAVSRGADRQTLVERSGIRPDDLNNQDNRIPLAHYLELMKAGVELCHEPALALLFGEAARLQDISIVGLLGMTAESMEEAFRQLNRYARLVLDEDDAGIADFAELVHYQGGLWLKATSALYVAHPLLTQPACAQGDPLHSCRAKLPRRIRPHLRRAAGLRQPHERDADR